MNSIKFSVIVPTYGVANYISDALGCLMNQTYDNFEVIIVDDCSLDRSGDIAKGFVARDDRFIYIRHDMNQGVSAARNTGIEKASGDYILFLDPDDTYEIHLLEVLARTLARNSVDYLVYSFTEDYRNKETGKLEYTKRISLRDLNFEDDVFSTNDGVIIHKLAMEMERITMLGYPWNKAFKASVIKDNNIRYQNIKHIEDILFNCDFLDHTRTMTIIADELYHYRNQGQKRLTAGEIDDYFMLQTKRVKRLYDQQQEWKTCDFDALGVLASEYFRSFTSNMVRMFERECSEEEILAWCNEEKESEMFNELKRYLPKDSKKIRLLYQPIADGCFELALRRAKAMEFTKSHMPMLFNKAKQIR